MNLIQELQSQRPAVRYAFFALTLIAVVALVGAPWFSSMKREVAVALGAEVPAQDAGVFAGIRKATGALTARVGSLFGLEVDADIVVQDNEVHMLPLSQPR